MSTEKLSTSKKYEDVSLLDWVKSHIRRAYRFGQRGDRTLEDFVEANEPILKIQITEHDRKQLAAMLVELESLKQKFEALKTEALKTVAAVERVEEKMTQEEREERQAQYDERNPGPVDMNLNY